MVIWFRRFGEIPGITYESPADVSGRKLPGRDAVPEIHVFELEGKRHETLWWPARGGGGSASPAHERAFGDFSGVTTPALLKNCHEGLELPGEPSDYHFLIQGSANALWARRREEPQFLADMERLCQLDIQLIEAVPGAVQYESGEGASFYSVAAFSLLINLYEREGALHEALDIAERASRCGQGDDVREQLVERIAMVESEHHE